MQQSDYSFSRSCKRICGPIEYVMRPWIKKLTVVEQKYEVFAYGFHGACKKVFEFPGQVDEGRDAVFSDKGLMLHREHVSNHKGEPRVWKNLSGDKQSRFLECN